MKTTKKRNAEFQKCKFVILNFCKDVGKINWGKEVKIAKKLLKLFPNMENWGKINMGEKPVSLSWFLTEEGNEFLILASRFVHLITIRNHPKSAKMIKMCKDA